jgi:AraC-like DNA-binding protein
MTEIIDDIRKIYLFTEACEKLASYIEFFSESSAELTVSQIRDNHFTVKMFPSWTPTIWINLGSPYRIERAGAVFPVTKDQDVLLLRDTTVTRHVFLSDHIFTIKFFPGGLEAITGFNQSHIKNRIIAASEILPVPLLRLLKQQPGFKARKELVESYFLSCLEKRTEPADHYLKMVSDCMDFYKDTDMMYNTTQIAAKMFVSSKTINRYFTRVVGLTPKKYFSILRARKALTAYTSAPAIFDAVEHGYYDMSHFYKEAIHFTGQSMRT